MSIIQEALDLWNETAAVCGWPLVRRLTSDRERKLRALLRNGIEDWKEALAKAQLSDFLNGRTTRSEKHEGWRFNFDFFITDSRFTRILEGNYDNAERATPMLRDPDALQREARMKGYREKGFWLPTWGPKPQETH